MMEPTPDFLKARAGWRRGLLPALAVVVVLAGVGVALKLTHADGVSSRLIHLAAPQVTLATSTAVETLRASDGQVRWRAPYGNAGALSGSGLVLVSEPNGLVHLLDGRDGKLLWTRSLAGSDGEQQFSASIITPDVVIFQAQTWQRDANTYHVQVLALATSDGHVAWSYHEDNVMSITLMMVRDMVLVADNSNVGVVHDISLSAFTARDGTLRWRYTRHAEHMDIYGIDGGTLIIRGAGLTALDVATGKLRWQASASTYDSLACVAGGVAYASIGPADPNVFPYSVSGIAAFRVSDGATLWQHILLPQAFARPLTCTSENLYVIQGALDNNQTILYRMRSSDGAVLTQRPLTTGTEAVNGLPSAVLAGDATSLALLDVTTDTPRWQITLPIVAGPPYNSFPRLADGNLYVTRTVTGGVSTTLYALAPATGKIVWQWAAAQA